MREEEKKRRIFKSDWVLWKARDTYDAFTDTGNIAGKAKDMAKNAKEKASGEAEMISTAESVDAERLSTIKSLVHLAVLILAIICVMASVLHFIGYGKIVGDSMLGTYQDGEHFLMLKHTDIEKGDVIVFYHGDEVFIKRVIATEGDTVMINGGVVYVNGEAIEEDYAAGDSGDTEEVTVGVNEAFVMGDNRDVSYDSRAFGTISLDDYIGEVVAVW